ncbi:MAG: O-antigen ligase family protein [Halalkalicoccus sp.]
MSREQRSVSVPRISSFETIFVLFLFAGVFKASPHLSWVPYDLTATFAALAGLLAVSLLLTRRVELRPESVVVIALFGLFLAYALLTVLWTPSEIYVREKAFRLASVTAFSLVGCALIVATERARIRRFLAATLVLALITAAATLYPFYHHGPVRIEPFGTTYLILGRMIGFGVVILAVYVLFVVESPLRSVAAFALLVPLALALVVLDGRGPLAATALTVFGLFVLAAVATPLFRRPERIIPATGAAAIVGAVVHALEDSLRVYRKFRSTFSDDPDPATTGRLANYEAAYETWRSGRTLTGHGLGSWGPLTDQTAHWPHNLVLELLVELGAIGLLLFLAPVAVGLVLTVGGYLQSRDPEYVAVAALFVYTFLNAQVTGDFNDNRFLFATIGLLCYRATEHRFSATTVADLRARFHRILPATRDP